MNTICIQVRRRMNPIVTIKNVPIKGKALPSMNRENSTPHIPHSSAEFIIHSVM